MQDIEPPPPPLLLVVEVCLSVMQHSHEDEVYTVTSARA